MAASTGIFNLTIMNKYRHITALCFYGLFLASLLIGSLTGCANRGIGPQGGPKDSIPPVPLSSLPEQGALNFKGTRVEVTFDEYIQLDNIASNLLMSPPQQTPPDVKARGKKLIIQFQDSLRDSTTYTIDFGSAVCDFREKVPLHGYAFFFSTGPEIDTLSLRGRVFDAETLNPVQGIMAGIHKDTADTVFTSAPFLRIAKTDSTGCFRIGNIHPGTYRLYAIDDISRDYRMTIGEACAYTDSLFTVMPVMKDTAAPENAVADTATSLAASADSIMTDSTAAVTVPLPALFLFKEEQQRLYLQRTLRDRQHMVRVLFSASPDSLPSFRALNDSVAMHVHYSLKGDTATIWLLDSTTIAIDTIFLEARFRRTDSLYNLEWYTDTLRAIWRAPRLTAAAKETQERKNRNRRMEIQTNARKNFELYDTLRILTATPIAMIEKDSFHLFERIDTVLKPVPFEWEPYDSLPLQLRLLVSFRPEGQYELKIDSAAMHDIYGATHSADTYKWQVKALADYSTLRVRLTPFNPEARIQILNSKDQVVRELPADPDGAFFEYLKPDTYYMRLYLDRNKDGKWTTGSWKKKRQPEQVYYFPAKIQTKPNWDFEEEWDYTAVPQTEAKPKEIITSTAKKK